MPFNWGQFLPPEQREPSPWPAIHSSMQHQNMMGLRREQNAQQNALAQDNMMLRKSQEDRLTRQEKRASKKDALEAMEKTAEMEAKFMGPLFSMVGKSGNKEQDSQDYKMARAFAAAKFTEIYGPEIAADKMQYIPEKYSPKTIKKIVDFYSKYLETPSERTAAANRKATDKRSALDRASREKIADKKLKAAKARAESGKYTKSQQVDDTRAYYKALEKSMIDADGYVIEGKEQEHEQLMQRMTEDLRAIDRGEKPSYLQDKKTVRKKLTPEVALNFLRLANGDRNEAMRLAEMEGYK